MFAGTLPAEILGRVVLISLPMRSWHGEAPFCSGVDLYAMSPRYGSLFFLRMFFMVLTALSASLLLYGYSGELVT